MKQYVEATAIYPACLPGLADIVLIRRRAGWRTASLIMGQYDIRIAEDAAEMAAVEAWLSATPPTITLPDGRRSVDLRGPLGTARTGGQGWAALYDPPAEGWPWLVVTRLPTPTEGLARRHYGTDGFAAAEAAHDYMRRMGEIAPAAPWIYPEIK
ncbi:hypothetical protein [Azospirillum sp. B506]|uniref:hypothetical protein n=1 Tax=Azospirillum sp. B506 TaxID=137721 RepID=UPI00034DB12E|nr:hypothetical protein [Azospirillum sp. B506]